MSRPVELPPRPSFDTRTCVELESAFFAMAPGYHVYRSRGTPTALVFYTLDGAGFFRSSRGGVHLARPGELAFYEPHAEQEYGTVPAAGAPWRFHWVHFFPRGHWSAWLKLPPVPNLPGLRQAVVADAGVRREVGQLWEGLHRDLRVGGSLRAELTMNTLERILILVWRSLRSDAHRPVDARVQAALEIISRDPAARHSVPALAQRVGLSPSRFAHLFRAETGSAVIETVLEARMKEAQKLLELTQSPISEIAYALGFSSPQHFSNQFARRYGASPRRYRARAQR